MERKRQKLMGWDKGSLTEQEKTGTVTATIRIRRIYKTVKQTEQLSLPGAPLPSHHCLASASFPYRKPA